MWHRWQSAFRFRGPFWVGSWFRCAQASTTRVLYRGRAGDSSADAGSRRRGRQTQAGGPPLVVALETFSLIHNLTRLDLDVLANDLEALPSYSGSAIPVRYRRPLRGLAVPPRVSDVTPSP